MLIMEVEFSSAAELYNRLKPALNSKKREFERLGYNYIKSDDIWNYLKEDKWRQASDLSLYQMVSAILNVSRSELDSYIKSKLNSKKRDQYFQDDESIL